MRRDTGSARVAVGRRREESVRRRESILAAARRCFGRDGYAGATVARIAEEARVSNGLLYQFFRSKDDLLDVVLRDIVRDWVRAMVPPDREERAADALESMLRRSIDFCRTHPLLPALLAADPALQLERLRRATGGRIKAHRELVATILQRGIDAGELRADLDVAAVADVVCQLQADYSRRAYQSDPAYPLDARIIDAVARFIRDALVRPAS